MAHVHLPDETLMAYADGELGADVAEAVEAAMLEDARVASRVVDFLRSRRIARAMASATGFPKINPRLDESIRRAIDGSGSGPDKSSGSSERRAMAVAALFRRPNTARLSAMAALLAVCALAAGTYAMALRPAPEIARGAGIAIALADPAIPAALASLPTGTQQRLQDGTLRAVASYKLPDGTLCREFEVSKGKDQAHAVSCRADRSWNLRLAVMGQDDASYAPAGGGGITQAYLGQIGAGTPLSGEGERSALER